MICPFCQAEVPPEERFCPSCKVEVSSHRQDLPLGDTCPSCDAAAPQGSRFCSQCGSEISKIVAPGARKEKVAEIVGILGAVASAARPTRIKNTSSPPDIKKPTKKSPGRNRRMPDFESGCGAGCLVAIILAVVVIVIMAVVDGEPESTGIQMYITKAGYVAAVEREWLDKATEYIVDKDRVALGRLIGSGKVFYLKPGVIVHRTNFLPLSGKVKIRPRGEIVEVWTVQGAIEDYKEKNGLNE